MTWNNVLSDLALNPEELRALTTVSAFCLDVDSANEMSGPALVIYLTPEASLRRRKDVARHVPALRNDGTPTTAEQETLQAEQRSRYWTNQLSPDIDRLRECVTKLAGFAPAVQFGVPSYSYGQGVGAGTDSVRLSNVRIGGLPFPAEKYQLLLERLEYSLALTGKLSATATAPLPKVALSA